jgi:hypothetical protein
MCRALYIASDRPLPLVDRAQLPADAIHSPTWPREAQRFYTAELKPKEEAVRSHFNYPHVLYAGSYEGCACGFNYGREHPQSENDIRHSTVARESAAELARYVRANCVREIYHCWMDDETKPIVTRLRVTPETLASPKFFFEDRELLTIEQDA